MVSDRITDKEFNKLPFSDRGCSTFSLISISNFCIEKNKIKDFHRLIIFLLKLVFYDILFIEIKKFLSTILINFQQFRQNF